MICITGTKECDGCMMCQEAKEVLKADDGTPIYEGDTYYDVEGIIITEDGIRDYKKTAEGGCENE